VKDGRVGGEKSCTGVQRAGQDVGAWASVEVEAKLQKRCIAGYFSFSVRTKGLAQRAKIAESLHCVRRRTGESGERSLWRNRGSLKNSAHVQR
jgi:hypothetical protein